VLRATDLDTLNMDMVYIIAGLIGLLLGGEGLVRGAVALAQVFGVSPMIVGLTLVGFGTSTPELVTSVKPAFVGAPGIAAGNVVGSNIANSLLTLGVAAIVMPIAAVKAGFWRNMIVLTRASAVCVIAVQVGTLSALAGMCLLLDLLPV